MAISRLSAQDKSNTSATSSVAATYPSTATSGNLLIASVHSNVGLGSNAITGWTKLIDQAGSAAGVSDLSIFYKLSAGTETTITATAALATLMELQIYEYTGNANPIVVDGTAVGSTSGASSVASLATGAITTSNASDLIFVAGVDDNGGARTWTTATGLISFAMNLASGQNIVSSTQSGYTDTLNSNVSGQMYTAIGAFQAVNTITTSTSSTSTSSTSTSTSLSTSSTSSSTSLSTSTSTSSTSTSTTASITTSTSSTSSSISTSISTSSTSTSKSTSTSVSTSSTSTSTSTSVSTSSTSQSTSLSTSSTSSSTSRSTSTSSTSQSTSTSRSTSTSSTSSSTSASTSVSTSSTSSSTSSTSVSTSSTTTLPSDVQYWPQTNIRIRL